MTTLKTTILGGVIFLVPVVVLIFIFEKAIQFSKKLAEPLDRLFPMDNVAGLPLSTLLSIFLLLLFCYVAGLVARGKVLARPVAKIESVLVETIPGFAVLKGMLEGFTGAGDTNVLFNPVLVQFDDYDQIAFEVERIDNTVVVFLPGAPDSWTGSSVLVRSERVTALDLPPHQVTGLLRVLGRGAGKLTLSIPPKH